MTSATNKRERGGAEGWVPMTFAEWVRSEATWFDRLRCRVFGHSKGFKAWPEVCPRCGKDPR